MAHLTEQQRDKLARACPDMTAFAGIQLLANGLLYKSTVCRCFMMGRVSFSVSCPVVQVMAIGPDGYPQAIPFFLVAFINQ